MTPKRTPQEVGRANRRAGAELELAARKALEAAGWLAVASKRSLGPADILAVQAIEDLPLVWLVQCKTNGYMPPSERTELEKLAHRVNADPVVADWHKIGNAARRVRFRWLDGEEVRP